MAKGVEPLRRRGQNGVDTLHRLERLTDADAALTMLERSLELAQLHTVPDDRAAFVLFVCGALFDAIAEQLGEDTAARLTDELTTPTLALTELAPDDDTRVGAQEVRVVIVASADPVRSSAIAEELRAGAVVHQAPDLVSLVSRIEENLSRPVLLVVDGDIPGLDGTLLPTLARLLPPDSKIVFRGDPPSGLYDVSMFWATLGQDAGVEDVVARCREGRAPRGRQTAHPVLVLVDPDESARALVAGELEREGFVVHPVGEALAGLEACLQHEPHLVLAAQEMPSLDGVVFARLVCGRLGAGAPPVILHGDRPVDDPDVAAVLPTTTREAELAAALRAHRRS